MKTKKVNEKRFQYRWALTHILYGEVEEQTFAYGRKEALRKCLDTMNELWGMNAYNVKERRKGYVRYAPITGPGIFTLEQVENPHWAGKAKPKAKPKEDPDRDPSDEKQLHRPAALLVDFGEDKLTRITRTPRAAFKTRQELPLDEAMYAVMQYPLRSFSGKRYRFTILVDNAGRGWMPILWLPDAEMAALLRDMPEEVRDAIAWRAMLEGKAEAKKQKADNK